MVKTPRDGYTAPAPLRDMQRTDGWRRTSDSTALDGSEWTSTSKGDRFTVKTSGKSVGWVTSTGPHRGRADVVVNGRVVDTVNLYSPQRRSTRVVWTAMTDKNETTRVTIINRSRASRPTIGVDTVLVQN